MSGQISEQVSAHTLEPQAQQNNSQQRIVWAALAAAVLMVVVLVTVLLMSDDRPVAGAGGADGVLGGEFSLQSAQGEVALSDFKDQVVVLYFGFLSCPEVCPTSMGMLKKALNTLDKQELQAVQPILITIDPARDTVDKLKTFTEYFHPRILGVTGTAQEIDNVARDYGAYFKLIHTPESRSEYVFEHTSRYYIINQNGELVDAMRHSTTANELVARIRTLL